MYFYIKTSACYFARMNDLFYLVLGVISASQIIGADTMPVESIDQHVLIKEYNHVFKVKGNPIVISRAGAVVAAEDRLRVLLSVPPDRQLDLWTVRNMSQQGLVQLLFYSVAGVYATDPHAQCPFLIDVDTGALEPVNDNTQTESVLIGMCVTLLCVLAVIKLKTKEFTFCS